MVWLTMRPAPDPPPQPTSFPDGYASSSVDVGNGWAQPSDSASFYTPFPTSTLLDAYPSGKEVGWGGGGIV
jgi:hypothetical protein